MIYLANLIYCSFFLLQKEYIVAITCSEVASMFTLKSAYLKSLILKLTVIAFDFFFFSCNIFCLYRSLILILFTVTLHPTSPFYVLTKSGNIKRFFY